jgi:hypothetical protein
MSHICDVLTYEPAKNVGVGVRTLQASDTFEEFLKGLTLEMKGGNGTVKFLKNIWCFTKLLTFMPEIGFKILYIKERYRFSVFVFL